MSDALYVSASSYFAMNPIQSTVGSPQSPPYATSPNSSKPSGHSSASLLDTQASVTKEGRTFIAENVPYPLPCDLQELTRQNLRDLLFKEVFGGYYVAEFPDGKLPKKVLDLGCGTGIWCGNVADEFAARGQTGTKFVGVDIAPPPPDLFGVDFTFVRHNLLQIPFPFKDGEFDFVFFREGSMTIPNDIYMNNFLSECVRILKVGGIFEIQCSDHSIRSLQPLANKDRLPSSAYDYTASTPFNIHPENTNIQLWNSRISHFLASRSLSAVPCTSVGPNLLMEPSLSVVRTIRRALPLDENFWEYPLPLSKEEAAVRHLARTTFMELVESIEPMMRPAEGIDPEEWDRWHKALKEEVCGERGRDRRVNNGECIEFGAWAAVKTA